jgi:hypothetical protein
MRLYDQVVIPDGRVGIIVAFQPGRVVVRAPAPNPHWPFAVIETLRHQHIMPVQHDDEDALL